MLARMTPSLSGCVRRVLFFFALTILLGSVHGQDPATSSVLPYDPDTLSLVLARRYLKGGDDARAAIREALQHMGWSIRDVKNTGLEPAPAGADTGLALRDYELEELLWKPSDQPTIRLISVAQALAVPFEDADPEELAQDLVDALRQAAESSQPQQRFWARFIIALGRAGSAGYDLSTPAPIPVIPPSKSQAKNLEREAATNPLALMAALKPTPVWPDDDPVLAPSPRPKRSDASPHETPAERDQKRLNEISDEMGNLSSQLGSTDANVRQAAQQKITKLSAEMGAISYRMQAQSMQQMSRALKKLDHADDASSTDESEDDAGPRFVAEWRDQPLSLLQLTLLTRVLAADIRLAVARGGAAKMHAFHRGSRHVPTFAMLTFAQVGAPAPSLGDQVSGSIGDIWATSWGNYTGTLLEHHLPDSKLTKGRGIANAIIAWIKTILSVARQNITIKVENEPLVRTKTRAAGEQRTAHAHIEIDFPKSDVLKAIRAAGNLTTIDLQVPDGGPVSGAKVVWRLPEGSYNTKYQTAKGGWEYKPELAVVQFAHAEGNASYVSSTNSSGDATITIEGVPQRKLLPLTVRPYPRRAVVAVEVTIKVGNLTQDFTDAINVATSDVISGGLSFIADMVMRTSFFFQKGKVFQVTDWKEPAWEGEFEITVKGSGSKHEKDEKGGPPVDYAWKMDRYMEGRLHTPDWEEETEQAKNYATDGRHTLEVDGDSRYFRLDDSSSSKTRKSTNRYEAVGPIQIQPPGANRLATYSRSEPSGSATLTFTGGKMILELRPFFGAECIVGRFEQNGSRSHSEAKPEFLSLLNGVYPDTFTIIESADETRDTIEGTKTFDGRGDLPYVPGFDVSVELKYHLRKNGPPPKNK
jgi:hypothetical protein